MLNNLEIAFVQLGRSSAPHLSLNVSRVRENFPSIPINLILDKEFSPDSVLMRSTNVYTYETCGEIEKLLGQRFPDKSFRENFWRLTLERLIAFLQFHLEYNDVPLLHVESDILLLPSMPMTQISELDRLSWMRVDGYRDVAAMLFSPSHMCSNWLLNRFVEILSTNDPVTDMTILRMIADEYPDFISLLPTLFEFSNSTDNSLEPDFADQKKMISNSWKVPQLGIFDPAGIGMWLTGIDPRNRYGVTTYFDTKSVLDSGTYFNPSKVAYRFYNNELFCSINGKEYSIWNLHVHSKDLKLFSNNWNIELERLVEKSRKGQKTSKLNFPLLVNLLQQNRSNKTLFRYILGIFPLNLIRKCARK